MQAKIKKEGSFTLKLFFKQIFIDLYFFFHILHSSKKTKKLKQQLKRQHNYEKV